MASPELEREAAKEKRRSRARSRQLATAATEVYEEETPPPAYTPIDEIDLEDEENVNKAIANLSSADAPVELEPLDPRGQNAGPYRTPATANFDDEDDLLTDEEDEEGEDDEVRLNFATVLADPR